MNERDFAYWLQGFFELTNTETLSAEQVRVVKEHLALVFDKVTKETVPSQTPYTIKTIPPLLIEYPLYREQVDLTPKITCAAPVNVKPFITC